MSQNPPAKRPVDQLQGMNLYLIGMMGCGKTTTGQRLAQALNYRFLDTDAVVTQVTHQSITEIFDQMGEAGFRDLESRVLSQVSAYQRSVVATGGGIVLRRENWGYLRQGLILWLDVPVEQLYQRLQQDTTRPLLQDPDPLGKLKTLLGKRRSLYAAADLRLEIQSGMAPETIVNQILMMIPTALKAPPQPPEYSN